MPFNYQSLKNLTGSAFIDGTIDTADIANTTLTAGKFALGSIDSTKLAPNAINTTTGVVTGTLPISRGGLGTNALPGANQAFYSNGSSLVASQHGIASIQVFTSSSTWILLPTELR